MASSVALWFLTLSEYKLLTKKRAYDFEWHQENKEKFHGYIDDTYGEYVLVDEARGLYKRSIYSYLIDYKGKMIKDIPYRDIFQKGVISDDWYIEKDEDHLKKWLVLFEENKDKFLYMEFH